jgi:hypothetical protein
VNISKHLRTAGVLICLAIAAAAMAIPAGAQIPPPEGGSTRPAVNMELVLRAAQLDPHRASGKKTKGAVKSVARVQRRLLAKKLLPSKKYVDGQYGSYTKKAYARWQRRLGYSGIGANGLPGPTSLKKLLGSKYTLYRPVSAGKHVLYDGHTVNVRTRAMMRAASRRLGRKCHIGITQGSYNAGGVQASAGTHDGGGAVDVNLGERCGKKISTVVRSMRIVGFAAWYRPTIRGLWNAHIHGIAISDPDLSSGAADQVWDYYTHHDGLAGSGADNGPRVGFHTWEGYKRAH